MPVLKMSRDFLVAYSAPVSKFSPDDTLGKFEEYVRTLGSEKGLKLYKEVKSLDDEKISIAHRRHRIRKGLSNVVGAIYKNYSQNAVFAAPFDQMYLYAAVESIVRKVAGETDPFVAVPDNIDPELRFDGAGLGINIECLRKIARLCAIEFKVVQAKEVTCLETFRQLCEYVWDHSVVFADRDFFANPDVEKISTDFT